MNIKLFKKEDAVVRKIAGSYSVANFLTASDSDKISVAVGTALNHNETTKTSSDRAYFIIEGEIIVSNTLIGNVGDVVYIPANTEYNFRGTFRAVIVNAPPFKLIP